jgi:WD40 repeat protein
MFVHSRASTETRDAYRIMSLAYNPDGGHIVTGLDRGGVKLWDLSTRADHILDDGLVENTVGYSTIEIIKYNPNGNLIASFGNDKIKIWNAENGKLISVLENPHVYKNMSKYDAVFWNDDKGQIICIGGGFIITWEVYTGKIVDIKKGEQFGMFFGEIIAINPTGVHLACGAMFSQKEDDAGILVWDMVENRQVGILGRQDGGITALIYSPDANYILSSGFDSVIHLWDTHSMTELYNIKGAANHNDSSGYHVYSLDFSPDAKYFIAALPDRIMLFETTTGKEVFTFSNPNKGRCTNAIFSPDGNFIAMGINHNIRIWDVSNGEYRDIMASEKEETCEYELREIPWQ